MGRADLTVHGFRSTFRDWAAEQTKFSNEVIEMALAHAIADKVEAAYRRGDLFEKRRILMRTWADYCLQTESGENVIQLQNALLDGTGIMTQPTLNQRVQVRALVRPPFTSST